MKVSVLTIVQGRVEALENMILGLIKSSILPDELIIVLMNEPERQLIKTPFLVRQITLWSKSTLPLAAARNLAAQNAAHPWLIFLDVDCIPAVNLVETYSSFNQNGFLLNGKVRYLDKDDLSMGINTPDLHSMSKPDPVRAGQTFLSHELFWSLNFSCSLADYQRIGGFDEGFSGYGAEDTDFAFQAKQKGIEMLLVDAYAYHQYHESYSPPLNHFLDIISNAEVFYRKWGSWPMEGWLNAFQEMRLIDFNMNNIKILRMPTQNELAACKKV
ncbi:MAG: hypothetical protein EOO86_02780 [Pedobacter sp.]|nr:MAG: hypothetical protein EOO86_02780 [Pedobacter sp.]